MSSKDKGSQTLTIQITDLTVKCIIGILPKERIEKQRVIINLSFDYEFKNDNFIDYSKITNQIEKIMKKKKFLLIEDAILDIEKKLHNGYKIDNLKLSITKPDILKNASVAVCRK